MEAQKTNQVGRSEAINWTEREKQLAERFGVESKTVRLLKAVILDVLAGDGIEAQEQSLAERFNVPVDKVQKLGGLTAMLLKLMLEDQGGQQVESDETEQDISTAVDEKRSRRDLIEDQVKKWLLGRSAETKMACLLFDVFGIGDYNVDELFNEIKNDYEQSLLEVISNPDNYSATEQLAAGLCSQALIWRNHY